MRKNGRVVVQGVAKVTMNVDQTRFKNDPRPRAVDAEMRVYRDDGHVLVYKGQLVFQHVELGTP